MKKALFFVFMDFLPVTMTGQRWAVLSVFMNQSIPNPRPPLIFDWGLFLYSREFAPKWGPPSQAFDFHFQNADQHCKQNDFLIFSWRSLLLYSLFCWSIWEPLKKPSKCRLCGMNNFKGGYCHLPIVHCGQTILSDGWIPVWLISKCCHGSNTLEHKRDS